MTRFAASLDAYEATPPRRAVGLLRNRYIAAHEQCARSSVPPSLRIRAGCGSIARCTHCGHPFHGKPHVQTELRCSFSLSHSGPIAVVAVATDGSAIGVDIEIRKPRRHLERLAARVLTPDEHHEWESLAPDERVDAFLRMWTAKEAFLKAVGRGLVEPMRAVPRQPAGWTVVDVAPVPGVLARWRWRARAGRHRKLRRGRPHSALRWTAHGERRRSRRGPRDHPFPPNGDRHCARGPGCSGWRPHSRARATRRCGRGGVLRRPAVLRSDPHAARSRLAAGLDRSRAERVP